MTTERAPAEVHRCHVLVLGTGIAGLYTALRAAPLGGVVLLTKKRLADSATEFAQGGIAAALAPGDSPLLHMEDTLRAGDGLCEPEAVRILTEEGPACVRELAALGIGFDMVGEDFELTREGAHSTRRIVHARGDATGDEIRQGLERHVRADTRVTIAENQFAVTLLVHEGRCCGALALGEDGRLRAFLARAVVLATGGAGQLYRHSTNPDVATGDGMALALRAGATLVDMEFIQFHPTALYVPNPPPGLRRPRARPLISEAVRGEGAKLLNVRGRRFMPAYHPLAELAPRDVVARAIASEMEKTASAYVLLDATAMGERFRERFPTIHANCLRHGIDPVRQPIPVAPAAHYIMGGVGTDLWGRTDVKGLYACGEVACTGVHGANRLASNSLLEGVVFGRRIARVLADELPALPPPPPSAAAAAELPALGTGVDIPAAWRSLQLTMWQRVGVHREKRGLESALAFLGELAGDLTGHGPPGDPGRRTERRLLELFNLNTLAILVTRAALAREESRGAHHRLDFPARDDARWRRHILFRGETMALSPFIAERPAPRSEGDAPPTTGQPAAREPDAGRGAASR